MNATYTAANIPLKLAGAGEMTIWLKGIYKLLAMVNKLVITVAMLLVSYRCAL